MIKAFQFYLRTVFTGLLDSRTDIIYFMTDVYLTNTFTNQWNVDFGPKLGELLEQNKLNCYIPYRDTNQKETEDEIFEQDMKGIESSKVLLAVAENESVNWGAEIGYAYKLGIPIIALKKNNHSIPLICKKMTSKILEVEDLDNFEVYIKDLVLDIKSFIETKV